MSVRSTWLPRGGVLPAAVLGTMLAACSTASPDRLLDTLKPYRVEVVQGNVVTQEMSSRLQVGQTREQVRNVLGSPLLTDLFHADRWDYVFTIRRMGARPQQRRVTIHFQNDRVSRIEAGDLPSEREFVASIDPIRFSGKVPQLQLDEQQLKDLPAPPPAAAAPAAAAAASAPQRVYPPLEPSGP